MCCVTLTGHADGGGRPDYYLVGRHERGEEEAEQHDEVPPEKKKGEAGTPRHCPVRRRGPTVSRLPTALGGGVRGVTRRVIEWSEEEERRFTTTTSRTFLIGSRKTVFVLMEVRHCELEYFPTQRAEGTALVIKTIMNHD